VAVIDSGIAPVVGLTGVGKVVNGPDLSFDSQSPDDRHLDRYGHGTHIAGIIAGRDTGALTDDQGFAGIAPGARLVNVKVADRRGVVDVSQVIAAIDWVVEHAHDPGFDIRVLNLSFGTDSEQSYLRDPLAYAAEVAWHSGIVVVTAAGNGGSGTGRLTNPAVDPYVIAVGGSDTVGSMTRARRHRAGVLQPRRQRPQPRPGRSWRTGAEPARPGLVPRPVVRRAARTASAVPARHRHVPGDCNRVRSRGAAARPLPRPQA
jgi:serine protease AprX